MTRTLPIRRFTLVVTLAIAAGTSAWGQYSQDYEPPRWHANGYAGFSLNHTSQEQTDGSGRQDQMFPLGDLRLNGNGFLLDPKFLALNTALDYQKGVNSSTIGDLDTGGTNLVIGSSFLPKSRFPLRVSYELTNHGVTGLGLNQNDDNSRLDVQWNVIAPNLPRFTVAFQKYDNTVHVPASFADRNYNETGLNAGASDTWKSWHWAGTYSQAYGDSSGTASILGVDSTYSNSTRSGDFNLNRTFWQNKARLMFENRETWWHDSLSGDGNNSSSEYDNNLNFDYEVTPRVTMSTGAAFTRISFDGTAFSGTLTPGSNPIEVLAFTSSTAETFSGRVDYRPKDWLRLSQDVRTSLTSPLSGIQESQTLFTDTASTVAAEHRWRSFDLMGSYTGRFELAGTNLDNTPNSWSNSFTGRVGWGNVKRVHLSGLAQDVHLNLVEQIGGFTHEQRVAGEAETQCVRNFRFRASAEYSSIDLLNIGGDTKSKTVLYSASADHRRFSVWFTASFLDGAGAIFPPGLIDRQLLVVPLPISQLLASPLLDRTSHAKTAGLIGRFRRNLDLLVAWRTEDVALATSDQEYKVLQADARYRIGKVSVEGGYSHNLNDVTNITGLSGNRLAVWYIRIGRDFKIL